MSKFVIVALSPCLLLACLLLTAAHRVESASVGFVVGAETAVDLGDLGGVSTIALAINDAQQVAGYSYLFVNTNDREAYIWDAQSGMTGLGFLGRKNSFALDINEIGEAVGYTLDDSGQGDAFLWDTTNGMRALGTLGGTFTAANALNDVGQVVGYAFTDTGLFHAFFWDAANGMQDLGTLGGQNSFAFAINERGQVVGSSEDLNGVYHPFLWDDTTGMTGLSFEGEALAINNLGEVAGVFATPDGAHAFVWSRTFLQTDFEGALPPEITSTDFAIEVMDTGPDGSYGDHGFSANRFYRTPARRGRHNLRIDFTDLPPHTSIDLDFLLAMIDRHPKSSRLTVRIDGVPIFRERIPSNDRDWNPGPPVELFHDLDLGYASSRRYGFDKAFDMGRLTPQDHQLGVDFNAIPHTANTLQIQITAKTTRAGATFAIDDLSVKLDADHFVDLGTLGGTISVARSINDSGVVTGFSYDVTGASKAFVWDAASGMQDLNQFLAPGSPWVSLTQAWSINNRNDIVGEGSQSYTRGFAIFE